MSILEVDKWIAKDDSQFLVYEYIFYCQKLSQHPLKIVPFFTNLNTKPMDFKILWNSANFDKQSDLIKASCQTKFKKNTSRVI